MPQQQRVNRLLFFVKIRLGHEQRRHGFLRALSRPQKIESGGQRTDAGGKDDAQKADGPRFFLFRRFFGARRGNVFPRFRRGRTRLFAFRFRKRDAFRLRPFYALRPVRRLFLRGTGATADLLAPLRPAAFAQVRQPCGTLRSRPYGPFELSAARRARIGGNVLRRRVRRHTFSRHNVVQAGASPRTPRPRYGASRRCRRGVFLPRCRRKRKLGQTLAFRFLACPFRRFYVMSSHCRASVLNCRSNQFFIVTQNVKNLEMAMRRRIVFAAEDRFFSRTSPLHGGCSYAIVWKILEKKRRLRRGIARCFTAGRRAGGCARSEGFFPQRAVLSALCGQSDAAESGVFRDVVLSDAAPDEVVLRAGPRRPAGALRGRPGAARRGTRPAAPRRHGALLAALPGFRDAAAVVGPASLRARLAARMVLFRRLRRFLFDGVLLFQGKLAAPDPLAGGAERRDQRHFRRAAGARYRRAALGHEAGHADAGALHRQHGAAEHVRAVAGAGAVLVAVPLRLLRRSFRQKSPEQDHDRRQSALLRGHVLVPDPFHEPLGDSRLLGGSADDGADDLLHLAGPRSAQTRRPRHRLVLRRAGRVRSRRHGAGF